MSFPIEVRIPTDAVEKIDSLDQFEDLVLELYITSNKYGPDILIIENLHGYNLKIGLANETFIQLRKVSGESPRIITKGDSNRMGTKAFYLKQRYPMVVDMGCLIPFSIARRVVNRFIANGEFSEEVKWNEE